MQDKQNTIKPEASISQHDLSAVVSILAQGPIFLRPDPFSATKRYVLFRIRKGLSISRGSYPVEAIQELASRGVLIWDMQKAELRPTKPGLARARREAAQENHAEALQLSPYAAQHSHIALEFAPVSAPLKETLPHWRNEEESPLAWLANRKIRGEALISAVQLQAGERLRVDLTIAAMVPRLGANWGAIGAGQGGSGQLSPTDMMLAARQRAQKALAAVGPQLNGILTDICGFNKGLEQIERERGWVPRSGKVVLKLALDALAAHYGLSEQAQGPRYAKSRHWGTADYRPQINRPIAPAPGAHPR